MILGGKSFYKFIHIDLGYYFKTLFLHVIIGLLENNMSDLHIGWCFKTTRMSNDENASILKTQVF
jgi:hypothetical protein